MDTKLSTAISQANEISAKANALATNLSEINTNIPINITDGIDPLFHMSTIFILACFVGYYVVWKVTPSLHTPLMSITNAISGIIILGALIASSSSDFDTASMLGFFAAFIAAVNIFGGFVVTQRMLLMFKKK